MDSIGISQSAFNHRLDAIANDFSSACSDSPSTFIKVANIRSDYPSVNKVQDLLKRMREVAVLYNDFLASDIDKCKKMGQVLMDKDQAATKNFDEIQ